MTFSVSMIVDVIVGCGIVVTFTAFEVCMWCSRRQREKKVDHIHVARLNSSRGQGEEQIPPGLEAVFNPMAQTGPGSVFDRSESTNLHVM